METLVLKFGGSSLSDNEKLNIVANKIIEFYKQNKKIVVVVSAQGKITDKLITEAKNLSEIPEKRELDLLLSTGEQMSIAKLSILLNSLGYKTVSLTGWQAGINTTSDFQNAEITSIDADIINKLLEENNIVVVAGFQGIDKNGNITTLGRGGSDTTAVALSYALKAKHCYIFSDVDGIYTSDPNMVPSAKKIDNISYDEMINISNAGAKVLHNKCVELAKEYQIPIETGCTFNKIKGTIINKNISEEKKVKSIIKNDNSSIISIIGYKICDNDKIFPKILDFFKYCNIEILLYLVDEYKITIITKNKVDNKILSLLHDKIIE